MNLHNLLKKNTPDSPAHEHWERAKEMYSKGEYEKCLEELASGFKKDVNYLPLYQLAADAAAQLDVPYESFTYVIRNPKDVDAYYQLGSLFNEGGDFELAKVFFEKVIELDPEDNDALYELAICHIRHNQVGKAIEVLESAQALSFWNTCWLNKFRIFKGDVEKAQESINQLQRDLSVQLQDNETEIRKRRVEELQETLQRYHRLKDKQLHIRDWQFIQYGNVVLDCYDDPDCEAGGRYVWAFGSHETMKAVANKLKQFVNALSIPIRSIAFLPDRDSEITGRVMAKILGVDCGVYSEGSTGNILIVAANSSLFNSYYEFDIVRQGQILFSLWHNWREPSYVCPDIIGLMAQSYLLPWEGGGMKVVDSEKGIIETANTDDRPADSIAEAICNCPVATDEDSRWLMFYAEQKDYLKGIGEKAGNNRFDFIVESPVPGSYFV